MRATWLILTALATAAVLGVALWLGSLPPQTPAAPAGAGNGRDTALRLGLLSEGDVFAQRRRYRELADHLQLRLGRPIELVTETTYDGFVHDFRTDRIDAAIVGPLGAVLLQDSCEVQVLARAISSYGQEAQRAVIFVRDDSRIEAIEHLREGSIAMVRSTACGELFPRAVLARHGLHEGREAPTVHWADGAEAVVRLVVTGRVHAGAVREARLREAALRHAVAFRHLVAGEPLPGPTLIVRDDLAMGSGQVMVRCLLDMAGVGEGRDVLSDFGVARFTRSERRDYQEVRRLLAGLDGGWESIGLPAPPARSTQVLSNQDG